MNGYVSGMQNFSLYMLERGLPEWLCGRGVAVRMLLRGDCWLPGCRCGEIAGCPDATVGIGSL